MLIVKLTEQADGSIVAETKHNVIGRFTGKPREDVVEYLKKKAQQCGQDLRNVDDFPQGNITDHLSHRDFAHLMDRHF